MIKNSKTTKYQDKLKGDKEILRMGIQKQLWIKELYSLTSFMYPYNFFRNSPHPSLTY